MQKKSWMTGVLFEEWVRKLDSSFRAQNRKIALLIDNCPVHPEINNFRVNRAIVNQKGNLSDFELERF